jgi:DNA-binding NarL/FixJ family response regulator
MGNGYDGVVERWKVRLVLRRARRLGLPRDGWDDVLQEIIPHVARFRFAPEQHNGAKESTGLTALVDKRLKMLVRQATRERRREKRYVDGRGLTADGPDTRRHDAAALRLDVRTALADLSSHELFICRRLSEGRRISQIARELGASWHRVERMVEGLRRRFEAMGLNGYLGTD